MRKIKSYLSILLSLIMVITTLSTGIIAFADEVAIDTVICEKTEGYYVISGTGELGDTVKNAEGDKIILADYITNNASVIIEEGITEILDGAFYGASLDSVVVPKSVKKIGRAAFTNCASLTKITIKNPNITIHTDTTNKANNAFGYDGNGNLIKNTVSYSTFGKVEQTVVVDADINSNAFKYAEDNGLIVYSENQKADKSGYIQQEIPARWYYFADTRSLYIEGVYNLAEYLFPYRGSNSFIKLGGDGVFRNDDGSVAFGLDVDLLYICSGVQIANANFAQINPNYVHIPNTVIEIGDDAFKDANKLKIVAIPNSVTKVGYGAFENCRALQRVTLSENQNSIYADCFKNCTSLSDIDLNDISYIGNEAFYSCTSLNEIIIPDSVVQIDNKAFENCLSVKRISIGKNCVWISSHAFSNMPFCTSIEVNKEFDPDGPNLVWDDAIWNIGFSTTGVELSTGDDVKIPDFSGLCYVFGGSKTKITSIHFGKNVENCANLPNMDYLKSFSVSKDNKNLYVYDGNVYYNKTLLIANPNTITVRLKEGTTSIGDMAFWKSKAMQISMPDTVTSIGAYAFYQCENLKRVNLSNRLLSVGDSAFEGCTSLLTIKFPSITNSIGSRCFYKCTSLQSAILPNWITKIDEYTFYGCSSLKGIVIPKLVNTIERYAFAGCKNMKNIFVPKTVTNIRITWINYNNALTIHTPNSSKAYDWAKNHDFKYIGYASTTAFNDVCDAQLESDGEFVDICKDGHGQTEYLTVYKSDCENDGYIIGVCEYCSTLIEEIHTEASGHNYILTADIPATTTTKGIKQYTCVNCRETYCDYTEPLEESAIPTTHNVTARVIYSTNGKLKGEAPVRRADVVIDGKTVATTDDNGMFTVSLETGSYTAEIKYAYGFTRTVGIVVEDEDVEFNQPIDIVGCDFNKDGKIDSEDTEMFSLVLSSEVNDPAYLDYCDFDHNGYINATDYAVIRSFSGTTADTYEYSIITIKK